MKKLLSILLAVLMAATLGVANITAEGEGSESDNVETFEIPVTYTVVKETNSSDVVVDDAPVKEVKAEIDADSFKQEVIKEDSSVKTELEDFQIEALNNGASANIELKVSNTSASEEDKKQVTDTIKADDTLQLGTFLDIELLCTVTDNNVPVGDPKNITQTDKEVTISLKVPDNLINTDHSVKRTYYVLRLHDGSVDELGTNFNNISGILTFKTNKFSLYAIAYKDAKIESGAVYIPSKKPVVNTGNVFEPAKIDIVGRTGSTTFKVEGLNESEVLEIEYDSKIELKSDDNETVKAAVSFVNSVNSDSTNIMTVTANKPDNPGVYKGTLTVTVTCKEYEAKIGNVYYDTINSAISASTENQTVKLLKNIDEQVMVPTGKSVTLDLNSKKISVKGIAIINNGSLVLENGTVESDSEVVFVGTDSTTVVNSGTYKGADVIVGNTENAVIEIKSGIFSSNLNDKYTKDKFIVDNGDDTIRVYSLSTDSEGNYLINSAADLVLFEKIVNESGYDFNGKTVKLEADVDLSGIDWTPVGTNADSSKKFKGIFDGQKHTISNMAVNQDAAYHAAGFFGALNGTARNITFDSATIKSLSSPNSDGATDNGNAVVAGSIYTSGLIENVVVKNSSVSANRYVGGISGYTYGSVKNCMIENTTIIAIPDKLTGTFDNGDKAGGVAGAFWNEGVYEISGNKVKNVTIIGYRDLGGVVGYANGRVYNNSVNGLMLVQDYLTIEESITTLGGIIGRHDNFEVDGSNVATDVNIQVINISNDTELSNSVKLVADSILINLCEGTFTTNFKIEGGKNITIEGSGINTVLHGQIASLDSNVGRLTIKNCTYDVDETIVDSTGISQTAASAIALWGDQTVICDNVVFNMSKADSTAITSWWSTGVGTSIVVKNCTFNCNGQRPIRSDANVTVENCIFNDPYRYAVQLTSKASTAADIDNAEIIFNNNTINNGENGKEFVYGIQLEGSDYGCSNLTINGTGNTINAGEWDTNNKSAMYYCECGKVDHDSITWNVEAEPVHEAN